MVVPYEFERDVLPAAEYRVLLLPELQRAMGGPKLGSAVGEVAEYFAAHRTRAFSLRQRKQRIEVAGALIEVNRPPVVRVDQAELPEFVALIKVGNPWNRTLQHHLRERVYRPEYL